MRTFLSYDGIAVVYLVFCSVGWVLVYRKVRTCRWNGGFATSFYGSLTGIPLVLGFLAIRLGRYLAFHHKIYILFGENAWGAGIFLSGLGIVYLVINALFCITLLLRRLLTHGSAPRSV